MTARLLKRSYARRPSCSTVGIAYAPPRPHPNFANVAHDFSYPHRIQLQHYLKGIDRLSDFHTSTHTEQRCLPRPVKRPKWKRREYFGVEAQENTKIAVKTYAEGRNWKGCQRRSVAAKISLQYNTTNHSYLKHSDHGYVFTAVYAGVLGSPGA